MMTTMWRTTLLVLLASCCALSSQQPANRPSKWFPAEKHRQTNKPFVIIVPEVDQNEVDYDSDDYLETAANSPTETRVAEDKPQVVVEVIKAMEIDLSNFGLVEGNGGPNGEEEEGDRTPYYQNLVVGPYDKVNLGDGGKVAQNYRGPFQQQLGERLVGSASGRDKFPESPTSTSCKRTRRCLSTADSNFSDDFDLESRTLLSNTLIRNDNRNEVKEEMMKKNTNGYRTGGSSSTLQIRPYFVDVGGSNDILKLVPVKKGGMTRDEPTSPVQTTLKSVNEKTPRRLNPIPHRLNVIPEEVMKNIDPVTEEEPEEEKHLPGRIKIKRKPVSHWDFGLKTVNRPRWSNNPAHFSQHNSATTDYRKVEPVNDNNYYSLLQKHNRQQQGSFQQEIAAAPAPQTNNVFSLYKRRPNYYLPTTQTYQPYTYTAQPVITMNQAFQPNVQGVNRDHVFLLTDYYPTPPYDIPKVQQTFQKRPVVWETIYLPRSLIEMYLQANKAVAAQNTYRVNENVEGYQVDNPARFLPLSSVPKGMAYISPPLKGPSYISIKNLGYN